MPFAGTSFNGQVSYEAVWFVDEAGNVVSPFMRDRPGIREIPAARWCRRCWKLIPQGAKAFQYYGIEFMLCAACHHHVYLEERAKEQGDP
jgi:hypothetical protein